MADPSDSVSPRDRLLSHDRKPRLEDFPPDKEIGNGCLFWGSAGFLSFWFTFLALYISSYLVGVVFAGVFIFSFVALVRYLKDAFRDSDSVSQKQKLLIAEQKRAQTWHDAYQESLTLLSKNPTDSKLKSETLELGRGYCRLAREGGNETLFDEVALMNDIGAACAGGSQNDERSSSRSSVEDRLLQLEKLREQNLISDTEYQQRRERILDEI